MASMRQGLHRMHMGLASIHRSRRMAAHVVFHLMQQLLRPFFLKKLASFQE